MAILTFIVFFVFFFVLGDFPLMQEAQAGGVPVMHDKCKSVDDQLDAAVIKQYKQANEDTTQVVIQLRDCFAKPGVPECEAPTKIIKNRAETHARRISLLTELNGVNFLDYQPFRRSDDRRDPDSGLPPHASPRLRAEAKKWYLGILVDLDPDVRAHRELSCHGVRTAMTQLEAYRGTLPIFFRHESPGSGIPIIRNRNLFVDAASVEGQETFDTKKAQAIAQRIIDANIAVKEPTSADLRRARLNSLFRQAVIQSFEPSQRECARKGFEARLIKDSVMNLASAGLTISSGVLCEVLKPFGPAASLPLPHAKTIKVIGMVSCGTAIGLLKDEALDSVDDFFRLRTELKALSPAARARKFDQLRTYQGGDAVSAALALLTLYPLARGMAKTATVALGATETAVVAEELAPGIASLEELAGEVGVESAKETVKTETKQVAADAVSDEFLGLERESKPNVSQELLDAMEDTVKTCLHLTGPEERQKKPAAPAPAPQVPGHR
ncbi:MAG: hypothetical protein C5B49_02250 [Bdellovibrio sp.]|nr:MAG: hypothetical protein C5B49_02250 [Bdellovibrio sp.]